MHDDGGKSQSIGAYHGPLCQGENARGEHPTCNCRLRGVDGLLALALLHLEVEGNHAQNEQDAQEDGDGRCRRIEVIDRNEGERLFHTDDWGTQDPDSKNSTGRICVITQARLHRILLKVRRQLRIEDLSGGDDYRAARNRNRGAVLSASVQDRGASRTLAEQWRRCGNTSVIRLDLIAAAISGAPLNVVEQVLRKITRPPSVVVADCATELKFRLRHILDDGVLRVRVPVGGDSW